jgi:protein PhnA
MIPAYRCAHAGYMLSNQKSTPHPAASGSHLLPQGEGRKRAASRYTQGKHHMDIKVRDSNGALLAEGDSVTLIKDLKLKGSSTVLKRGTVIKGIHLTDNADEIEGRTDKVKGLVLRTEFLKKA